MNNLQKVLFAAIALTTLTVGNASAALSTAEQGVIDAAEAKGLEAIAAGALMLGAIVGASLAIRFVIKMVKRATTAV